MRDADKLRQQAEELLTLAIKANEAGQYDQSELLLAESAKRISDTDALEAAEASADQQSRNGQHAQQRDTKKE